MCSCRFDKIKIGCDLIILGDPGADSRGKGKSKRPSTPLSAPGSPRMLSDIQTLVQKSFDFTAWVTCGVRPLQMASGLSLKNCFFPWQNTICCFAVVVSTRFLFMV